VRWAHARFRRVSEFRLPCRIPKDYAAPGVRPKEPTPVTYEEFKALVRQAGEARAAEGGLIPIPELRRECRPQLARVEFDAMLTALHAEGHIHLLSHVDGGLLSNSTRADCFHHPSGASLYWIRWL
jgi:hypothetical protein